MCTSRIHTVNFLRKDYFPHYVKKQTVIFAPSVLTDGLRRDNTLMRLIFVAWLPWQPDSHCYQNDPWGDVSVFGQV